MTDVFSMDWLGLGVQDHALQATSKGIKQLHTPEGSPSALEPYNTTMKETEPMDDLCEDPTK